MEPRAEEGLDLGYERTRMAADRTLMAWIRTSVSMISFGFTIFKFFQYLRDSQLVSWQMNAQAPRNFGLVLVLLGTTLMALAIGEYILYERKLSRVMKQKYPVSTALIAALLISILGLLAIANLAFNAGPL